MRQIIIIQQVRDCHATLWSVWQSGQKGMILFLFFPSHRSFGSNDLRRETLPPGICCRAQFKVQTESTASQRPYLFALVVELF